MNCLKNSNQTGRVWCKYNWACDYPPLCQYWTHLNNARWSNCWGYAIQVYPRRASKPASPSGPQLVAQPGGPVADRPGGKYLGGLHQAVSPTEPCQAVWTTGTSCARRFPRGHGAHQAVTTKEGVPGGFHNRHPQGQNTWRTRQDVNRRRIGLCKPTRIIPCKPWS